MEVCDLSKRAARVVKYNLFHMSFLLYKILRLDFVGINLWFLLTIPIFDDLFSVKGRELIITEHSPR